MLPELVFYDGDCGLCHRAVRFLLARDPDGSLFLFAPLFGETFDREIPKSAHEGMADSVIVLRRDRVLLDRAGGVFHALRRIGGVWGLLGTVGDWLPSGLTDWGYDRVGAVRHHLFKRPAQACPVPPAEERGRFVP